MKENYKFLVIFTTAIWFVSVLTIANAQESRVTRAEDIVGSRIFQDASKGAPLNTGLFDPLKYTLGADDTVEISVMRHPEFSGIYIIDQEGKLQYKFVGDMDVRGLTKAQLEQKIKDALATYINSPEVNVTIIAYRSKVIYVLGEVSAPGKYYMRSETIPVREAVFEAGLPNASAAMRKCQLITPSAKGTPKVKNVNLYSILYGGNLKRNIDMHPGDVLYVPSTIMAKIIKVINPVASTVGIAASGPDSAATGRTAVETLQGRPRY